LSTGCTGAGGWCWWQSLSSTSPTTGKPTQTSTIELMQSDLMLYRVTSYTWSCVFGTLYKVPEKYGHVVYLVRLYIYIIKLFYTAPPLT